MLDLHIATYLAIALFFIRKTMRKCQNYSILPLPKSIRDSVEQLFANCMAKGVDEVDRTVLRQLMAKAAHDFSVRKLTQAADHMVSIKYSEALRDAASKQKEACERMAAAISANQLKMPGGSEEIRAVLGGEANIPFDSGEVLIGTPSHSAMMREVSASLSEKKEYVCHPIYHHTEDTVSESGGSDAGLSF